MPVAASKTKKAAKAKAPVAAALTEEDLAPLIRRAKWLEKRLSDGPPERTGKHYDEKELTAFMKVFAFHGAAYAAPVEEQPYEEPPRRSEVPEVWSPGAIQTKVPYFRTAGRYMPGGSV